MKRRNKFSLSHYKLLTGKMGYLYPIACVETLPGDTFQMATSVFLRFSPMVAPVMTPVTVKVHHWFVPLRLIWDEFEDFITGGPDGTSVPVPPYKTINTTYGVARDNVINYLGVPLGIPEAPFKISALPLRAYRLIWNEWYRDQNLQDELNVPKTSGPEAWSEAGQLGTILRSSWDKDYFTTAAPWEQKGAAVSVPVSGNGNLVADGPLVFKADTAVSNIPNNTLVSRVEPTNTNRSLYLTSSDSSAAYYPASYESGIAFDASQGLSINLNNFREAMALQRFEEHRALYGSRYVEYLRYLGVKASDGRLQRPEYLGGGRSVIQFSEVLQTAEDGDTPVGTMRGHGIGAMRTNRFRRFFEEHGFVISLLSIRPKSIYMHGLPRMFSRELKTDFWQKELEHIGQQEVKNKEVFAFGSEPDGTFGYSDRYNEYRQHPSSVCGEFTDLLNYWHLARDFSEQPVLNSDFISSLPSDRIFADRTGNDTIYMMVNNSIQARRLVSRHGSPR